MALSENLKPYYSPAEIAGAIIDSGYKAEPDKLESGRNVIRSAASGYRFSVLLYGPNDNPERVDSIQFRSFFTEKRTLEQVNKWNLERRFLKCYVTEEGSLCFEMDVIVSNVATVYIKECISAWELILARASTI